MGPKYVHTPTEEARPPFVYLVLHVTPSRSILDTVWGEPVPIVLAGTIVITDHPINCLD